MLRSIHHSLGVCVGRSNVWAMVPSLSLACSPPPLSRLVYRIVFFSSHFFHRKRRLVAADTTPPGPISDARFLHVEEGVKQYIFGTLLARRF